MGIQPTVISWQSLSKFVAFSKPIASVTDIKSISDIEYKTEKVLSTVSDFEMHVFDSYSCKESHTNKGHAVKINVSINPHGRYETTVIHC